MLDKVEMLERLTAMWRAGTLTDAEFEQQKTALLAQLAGSVAPEGNPPKGAWSNDRLRMGTFAGKVFDSKLLAGGVSALALVVVAAWFMFGTTTTESRAVPRQAAAETTDAKSASDEKCNQIHKGFSGGTFGSYGKLGYWAVVTEHPNSPHGLIRAVIDNHALTYEFYDAGNGCRARYSGSQLYEGTEYRFNGTCELERDPEPMSDGTPDYNPVRCQTG